MEQGQIIFWFLFPSDQNPSKAVHPTMRSFCHPASGLEPRLVLDGLRFFPASPNMRCVTKLPRQIPDLVIIVAFIEAKILRPIWSRTFQYDAFERCPRHLHIVPVGAVNRQTNRNPGTFTQQTAFDASFGPIGWIGTCFFPLLEGLSS